jgi:O-antigen/teichoic acid export membrane protein
MGRILGVIPMTSLPIKIYKEAKIKNSKKMLLRKILKKNKFLIPAGFLEAGNTGLVIFMISIFYGYQFSGFVGLAQSLLMVPITLLAGSIGSIISAEVSAVNRDSSRETTNKMQVLRQLVKPVFVIFVLYVAFFLLAANFLLQIIFSEEWTKLNVLIPILSIPIGINFFWNPFINLMYVEGRWVRILKINLARLVTVAIASIACVTLNQSWIVATVIMFGSGAMVQLISMLVSLKKMTHLF